MLGCKEEKSLTTHLIDAAKLGYAQLYKYNSAAYKLITKFNKYDLVFTYTFHRINIKVAYYTCTIS